MTHITKLTEIVDGRLLPSDKKLSASLLEVDAGRLTITGNTLGFDETGLATESFVTNAILGIGETDLSTYATKVELSGAISGISSEIDGKITTALSTYPTREEFNTSLGDKVDKVAGKSLSTNDFTDVYKTSVDNIETSISTAIAALVDGAPTTFDTLREIAAWIENEGVAATDLASAVAGKADRTELSDYATTVAMTQLEGQVLDGLSSKVDKVEGKGLSTEDFTTAYKTKLDDIDNQKLDIPTSLASSAYTTPTVNSIPLYTLGNNGEYVLCTPDAWLSINGFLVPGYNPTTIQG